MATREIVCPACGQRAWTRVEAVYDGFKKTGEVVICTACGARHTDATALTYVQDAAPAVFTEADKPERLSIFSEEECHHSCAYCRHFVVNPFTQRCGLTNRETEATALCIQFQAKEL